MEFTKGDKTFKMPVLGVFAGALTVGAIVAEICNVIAGKQK